MSVHPFPAPADESAAPSDADLVSLAMNPSEVEQIMQSPEYIFSREEGFWSVALLFQTFEDHGDALTDDDAGDMFLGLVMDEIKRVLDAENQPIAGARLAGFCECIGRALFNACKAGTYGQ